MKYPNDLKNNLQNISLNDKKLQVNIYLKNLKMRVILT